MVLRDGVQPREFVGFEIVVLPGAVGFVITLEPDLEAVEVWLYDLGYVGIFLERRKKRTMAVVAKFDIGNLLRFQVPDGQVVVVILDYRDRIFIQLVLEGADLGRIVVVVKVLCIHRSIHIEAGAVFILQDLFNRMCKP